jgi:hypothetical protein
MEFMRRVILVAVVMASSPLTAADPPRAEIANGVIHAKLYLPDAANGYYRATRFDWSGVVASLEFQGHNYFGVWFPRYDPKLHDAITGPVEEYRTGDSALGYAGAKVGENFLRIGVGLLKKPEEPRFQQFKTYEITDNGKWTVKTAADSVEFTQEVADPVSGYAYLYKKTVSLAKDAPRMVIEHSLKNTGKKVIETNVYNHGFFVIDSQPSGPDFTVKFPFEVKAAADLHGLAEVGGKELHYLQELRPGGQSVHSELTGFGDSARDFDFRVENRKTGAGVHVTGDHALSKIDFWSIRNTLCPEAYIEMKIEPGQESHWRIAYDFYVLPAAQ